MLLEVEGYMPELNLNTSIETKDSLDMLRMRIRQRRISLEQVIVEAEVATSVSTQHC